MSTQAAATPLFAFNGQQVRHAVIGGEPWLVAADVCRCLGMAINAKGQPNVTMALAKLPEDERGFSLIETSPNTKTPKSRMAVISESGIYKLIMRANPSRPEVFNFQQWVTKEVLPAIRKTGGYLLNESMRETAVADSRTEMPIPTTFAQALRLAADEYERREAASLRCGVSK